MGGSTTCNSGRRVRAVGSASLLACIILAHAHLDAGSTRPYYKRRLPAAQNESDFTGDSCRIDLRKVHLPPYPEDPGVLADYNQRYDARAAAIIRAAAGPDIGLRIFDDPDAY